MLLTKVPIDYLERIEDWVVWGPIFRRNLNEVEKAQSRETTRLIGNIFIPKNGTNGRVWITSTNGMFSVAYLFLSMTREAMVSHPQMATQWRIKAPPRVIAFGWSALLGGILTMDNLRRRRVLVVNACPMCLSDEESIDHLLLNCKTAQYISKVTLGWF